MIFARKVDGNHKEIVSRLRALKCQVHDLSRVGKGFPDILVNVAGKTYLCEIKAENGSLTPDQRKFHDDWSGPPIVILKSIRDAECFVIRVRNEQLKGY